VLKLKMAKIKREITDEQLAERAKLFEQFLIADEEGADWLDALFDTLREHQETVREAAFQSQAATATAAAPAQVGGPSGPTVPSAAAPAQAAWQQQQQAPGQPVALPPGYQGGAPGAYPPQYGPTGYPQQGFPGYPPGGFQQRPGFPPGMGTFNGMPMLPPGYQVVMTPSGPMVAKVDPLVDIANAQARAWQPNAGAPREPQAPASVAAPAPAATPPAAPPPAAPQQ
jgi:hypothetical protein